MPRRGGVVDCKARECGALGGGMGTQRPSGPTGAVGRRRQAGLTGVSEGGEQAVEVALADFEDLGRFPLAPAHTPQNGLDVARLGDCQ